MDILYLMNNATTETKTMTAAQSERTRARSGGGKFIKNPCDCCGKGAPMVDYFSDVRDIEGENYQFITLCNRCATKLSDMADADFKQVVDFNAALASW